ncbi:MAG: hypothetical protein E7298_07080 [Lachnospiraceae bacterium]|jgi:hypothetical protein|nr:hypothetical protein [Lachnospiraceae bacterium]MBQ8006766.1 hypothetical protein [Lachnospiraceae bacterium]MBQ8668023.1 hypothetical protein [Lachnospiraceae bacterium]MBR1451695.1 hypothetical protein [Lachnospiraceae bacterium]
MTEYSRDDYRRISGVGIINRSGPDAGGSGGMYRDNRRKKGNGNFASILQGEQHKENEEISVKSTGYGPSGTPINIMIQMKDYTFQ